MPGQTDPPVAELSPVSIKDRLQRDAPFWPSKPDLVRRVQVVADSLSRVAMARSVEWNISKVAVAASRVRCASGEIAHYPVPHSSDSNS